MFDYVLAAKSRTGTFLEQDLIFDKFNKGGIWCTRMAVPQR